MKDIIELLRVWDPLNPTIEGTLNAMSLEELSLRRL